MIAYVKGELAYVHDRSIIVEACGVGYSINMSTPAISRLPGKGSEVKVFTYHQVTENSQSLHGFLSQEEVRLFTLLISISGIGPKVASAILGTLSPSGLMMAIMADDAAAVSKAPGVGKKTAQRVMLELRDKIKTDDDGAGFAVGSGLSIGEEASPKQDAMDALAALGYGRTEAAQAVLETAEEGMGADQIIRFALKKLAR